MEHPFEKSYLKAFDEHADGLFRHAQFRLSSRERASDLVQDAFMKAWDYLREGGEIHHWKSFLFRTLNNLIIDEYRRKKPESLDALLEDEPLAENPLLADGGRADAEEKLDTELMVARIRTHISELPELYRAVITLRFVDGFSPKEISTMLDLSENVVSVRLHRGIERLKKSCGPAETP